MKQLSLTFLGRFCAQLGQQPLPGFRTKATQALLIYLASQPEDAHNREQLMTLLWPGMPLKSARANLRQTLYQLRQDIPDVEVKAQSGEGSAELITANRQVMKLNPDAAVLTDVVRFESLLNRSVAHDHLDLFLCPNCRKDLEQAVDLYQGDFLSDFFLEDSNDFEEWAQSRREYYRRRALDALANLTTMAIRRKEYPQAQQTAERQLQVDNLNENAYRQLMEIHALNGRREQALAAYEKCRRVLAEELGMAPTARSNSIYERIVAGNLNFHTADQQAVRGYDLKEQIGEGAHGAIHRAIQPGIGREVAVKVIRRRYADDPGFIRRFEAEAQIVARLEHPHIVPLYDYWRDPHGAYLVMRYMRHGSLLAALEDGPWNLSQTAALLTQIAAALAAAHQQGVVHRDLKPGNILLDEAGNAYLTDFGIAKDLLSQEQITSEKTVVGTLDYTSPEQILSGKITPHSDIYSLGAVIYETLTGEKPFAVDSIASLLHNHLNNPMPLVTATRPDIPAEVDTVLQKATAKKAAERYATAQEMAKAFFAAVGGTAQEKEDETAERFHPEVTEIYNPYKGLRAFQEADADDFFGRDALVQQLVDRLGDSSSRFLAIVGPSGSGKSSAVKAGLIPALRHGALPGSENWFTAEMVPGTHPLEELELALWPVAVDPPPSLVEPMQRDTRGMLRTLRRILPEEDGLAPQLLLIIDQFEELFTLVDDPERREFFLDSLLTALTAPRSPLRVVLTLRADFYDRPLLHRDWGQIIKDNTEIVLPLNHSGLTWAIREPARRMGVRLEEELVATIVGDVADQLGGLPLLQYALTELFERREGNVITRRAYEDIGGVQGALGRRAEAIFASLDENGREATRQLFLRLVTLGEGSQDTRRRVLRSELTTLITQLPIANYKSQINPILDQFGHARLLTFDRDPTSRTPTVEVAHEALLREWPRLRRWLEQSRDDVRLQRLLDYAAKEWEDSGKDEAYLLRGSRLDQFGAWSEETQLALTQDETNFLAASLSARTTRQEEEEARRQRELQTARQLAETEKARAEEQDAAAKVLRRRAYILGSVLVVALLLAVAAFLLAWQSNQNAQTAEEQARIAFSRELAAGAIANLVTDPERSVLLALQALSEVHTREAEVALHLGIPNLRVLHTLVGHEGIVESLDYSPDGSRLATGGRSDGTVLVWDTSTGQELLRLTGHEGAIGEIAYSPDGTFFATAGEDGTARVWNAANGEVLHILTGHRDNTNLINPDIPAWVAGIDVSPDSKMIATGGGDGLVKLWDADTGAELKTISLPEGIQNVVHVAFSPDGSMLAVVGRPAHYQDTILRIVDVESGEELMTLEEEIGNYAFTPDGSRLLIGDNVAQAVRLWDMETGTELARYHVAEHAGLEFSPDGSLFATNALDGGARIWETETGRLVLKLSGHQDRVFDIRFSPNGRNLATISTDNTARIWDIGLSHETLTLQPFSDMMNATVSQIAFSQDGTMLAAGGYTGGLSIWDARTGDELLALSGHNDYVGGLGFIPDGSRLASASDDRTIKVWNTETGELLLTMTGHEDIINNLAYSPDGSTMATVSNDDRAIVWNAANGEIIQVFPLSDDAWGIAYSPDSTLLAAGEWQGAITIWDLATGEVVQKIDNETGADDVYFTPDGSKLIAAGMNGSLKIWDSNTGALLHDIKAHQSVIWGLAISPEGSKVATAAGDRTARLWDVQSGERLLTLEGHEGTLIDAEFTPDGTLLATAGDDTVRFWVLSIDELIGLAESRLTRSLTEEECQEYLHLDACPSEP